MELCCAENLSSIVENYVYNTTILLIREQGKLYLSTQLLFVFCNIQTPRRLERLVSILQGVPDHAGECGHLCIFTKFPQNSAAQAFKVILLFVIH